MKTPPLVSIPFHINTIRTGVLTPEIVLSFVESVRYFTANQALFDDPKDDDDKMTFCVINLINGIRVVGVHYGHAKQDRFYVETGREQAYEEAMKKACEACNVLLRGFTHMFKGIDPEATQITSETELEKLGSVLDEETVDDVARFRFLSADHPDPEMRAAVSEILTSMSTQSLSAVRTRIDGLMKSEVEQVEPVDESSPCRGCGACSCEKKE